MLYTHQRFLLVIFISALSIVTPLLGPRTVTAAPQSQRASGRIEVTGEVVKVNTEARSMTLRSGGSTISVDISNPVLQGYGSLTAISKGDRVGVAYTADGIRITKLSRIAEKTGPEKSGIPSVQKGKKPSPFARRAKIDGKSFSAVDNNKDGKISTIELCVVIPELTVEQFRQYDRNHDGYLDKAEFEQVKFP